MSTFAPPAPLVPRFAGCTTADRIAKAVSRSIHCGVGRKVCPKGNLQGTSLGTSLVLKAAASDRRFFNGESGQ